MNKRLFSIVLILTMVVFLFAGCGKNKPSTDGTLIGTWRCDESSWNEIVKVDGVIVYEDSGQTIYPETEEGDGNFTREFQPYYQITSDKFKLFLKLCFNNVPAELDLPEGYFYLLMSEVNYSVDGKKITLSFEENSQEATFTIGGNTLTFTDYDIGEDEYWNEETGQWEPCTYEYKEDIKSTKVSDSDVKPVINITEYPDLMEFIFGLQ